MSTGNRNASAGRLLVAAGQADVRLTLKEKFEAWGHEVTLVPDLQLLGELLQRNDFDLSAIVHDPESMNGIEFMEELPDDGSRNKIIIIAENGTIEDAVRAMQLGARDFLANPWNSDKINCSIRQHLGSRKGGSANALPRSRPGALKSASSSRDQYTIISCSQVMKKMLAQARSVAPSRATVLIQGESGTGKELMARFIHNCSDRADKPFVAMNCAALPENLLESELFGHEKGAFSGALNRKPGKFELADGGTLLLDEVTEMALPLQAKLLRVLQEREVDRVGGTRPVKVDVRIIATTNRDLPRAVSDGKFRNDLYYRLNVIPFVLPALRERPEDIPVLAEHFLQFFVQEYGKNGTKFAKGVIEELENRQWPGNIREIRNLIERGVLLAEDGEITLKDLLGDNDLAGGHGGPQDPSVKLPPDVFKLSELERETIKRALTKTGGNRTHASKLLGISVRTLRNKIAEYRQIGLVL
ncbi:MAG TPA: sigma-54-dependent Fis family transcriptional regulator [Thermodesulfobacteriaceae bacterium]|nr:sigma-54-dependent Fis family transcriptional regulator [Thermodesulfobacteriaceae bacterium]